VLGFCARPQSERSVDIRQAQESIVLRVQSMVFQCPNLSISLRPLALLALHNLSRAGATGTGFTGEWD
jgi:hypothetical protein